MRISINKAMKLRKQLRQYIDSVNVNNISYCYEEGEQPESVPTVEVNGQVVSYDDYIKVYLDRVALFELLNNAIDNANGFAFQVDHVIGSYNTNDTVTARALLNKIQCLKTLVGKLESIIMYQKNATNSDGTPRVRRNWDSNKYNELTKLNGAYVNVYTECVAKADYSEKLRTVKKEITLYEDLLSELNAQKIIEVSDADYEVFSSL